MICITFTANKEIHRPKTNLTSLGTSSSCITAVVNKQLVSHKKNSSNVLISISNSIFCTCIDAGKGGHGGSCLLGFRCVADIVLPPINVSLNVFFFGEPQIEVF